MAHLCDCGEELVVHVSERKQTTYCQNCGREEETELPAKKSAPVIPITRATILKQMDTPQDRKPKPLKQQRDRRDYTAARRFR